MKKILINASIIAIAAVAIIGATVSYFSDTETSSGNQFIADTLGLQVGDSDPTTWKFAKENILPGDSGKEGVALFNNENMDGDLNISFANLSDEENVCREPEYADEPDCGNDNLGELGKYMDILAYLDENNNGNYDPAADTFIYQGKANGILGGGLSDYFLPSGATEYFMLEWNLDSSVLNMAQSDKIVFDIVFDLNQTNNPGPTSICGNNIKEGAEQCDNGGSNGTACSPLYGGSCNYCSDACLTIILTGGSCGDGTQNGTEACDNGANNGIFGYCNSSCTGPTPSVCGNNVKEGGEECDGIDGVTEHHSCTASCVLEYIPYCGDGIKDADEECDDNGSNGTACSPLYGGSCNYCSDACLTIILTGGSCGDGTQNGTEACDNGANNGIFGYCNSSCTGPTPSVCGNGAKEGTEQCDDGNTNSGDGCSSVCQDEPMLTIGSQSASLGNNITVPIIATNAFSNVGSVMLYINYNSSLLSYLNPGFTLVKLPPSTITQSGDKITVLWYDSTGTNPISFNSGDVLMYLNFNVSASLGTANLTFSSASMVGDSSGNKIPTVFANGVITIN